MMGCGIIQRDRKASINTPINNATVIPRQPSLFAPPPFVGNPSVCGQDEHTHTSPLLDNLISLPPNRLVEKADRSLNLFFLSRHCVRFGFREGGDSLPCEHIRLVVYPATVQGTGHAAGRCIRWFLTVDEVNGLGDRSGYIKG